MDTDRDRVRLLSNRIERSELKPGDHIYTWRTAYLYAHHGIYVGDNKVIHFTRVREGGTRTEFWSSLHPASAACQACADAKRQHQPLANGGSAEADGGDSSQGSNVRISCLDCFLRNRGHLYLYAYAVNAVFFMSKMPGTCSMARADPPEKVLHRVFYLLKHGFGNYCLFTHNCEDFSIYSKTELVVQSYDIAGLSNQMHGKISGVTITMGGDTMDSYFKSELDRYRSDFGIRKDVVRVPVEKLVEASKQKTASTP